MSPLLLLSQLQPKHGISSYVGTNISCMCCHGSNFHRKIFCSSSGRFVLLMSLMRTQVAVTQLVSACTLQRSEHIVGLTYKFNMVRNIEHLGPDGTDCDIVVANKGKVNKSGHVEVRGIPPHMKNQMDGLAMMGLLLVLRHTILGETFPDFLSFADLDAESYVKRFLLRGMNNYRKPVNVDDFCKAWSAINHACGILVEKVTHQNRVEIGEAAMDRKCSSTMTECLLGHKQPGEDKKMNDAQRTSYTLLPPAEGLAAVGGGDPQNPSDYLPLWSTVTEGTEEVMRLIAPWFYSQSDLVNVKIDEIQSKNVAKTSYNLMEDDRLFMARGALDSVELRLRRFFQVAACRPVDSKGLLQVDSPPNYIRWGSHPVFQHVVFRSECFVRLVHKMKQVQDDESNMHVDLTVPCKNEVERVVKSMVARPLNSHFSAVNNMAARLGNLESSIQNMQNLLVASTPPRQASTRAAPSPGFSPARAIRFAVTPAPANQIPESPAFPTLTKTGKQRERAYKRDVSNQLRTTVGTFLWSTQFVKAEQYWDEFQYGIGGRPPLRRMEDDYGSSWRNDSLLGKTNSGKKSTVLKVGWSQRCAIYNYIIYRTMLQEPEESRLSEVQACGEVQEIFDAFMSQNGKPKMVKVVQRLNEKLVAMGGTKSYPYPNRDSSKRNGGNLNGADVAVAMEEAANGC